MNTRLKNHLGTSLLVLLLFASVSAAAEDGDAARTGFYKTELSTLELLGDAGASNVKDIFKSDDNLSWQIYVPDNYDAARPAGAVVYVSPSPRGGPPRGWDEKLGDANLIWIGANDSGNKIAVAKRMLLAMLAPRVLVRDYVIDVKRIYLAGFSGGGKTASLVSSANPEVFRGGIYIGGAEAWKSEVPPPKLDLIKLNHHVFVTGSNDFNERLTRRVYSSYKAAGVENCKLIVVRGMGHQMPRASVFLRAIDYLDSRVSSERDQT